MQEIDRVDTHTYGGQRPHRLDTIDALHVDVAPTNARAPISGLELGWWMLLVVALARRPMLCRDERAGVWCTAAGQCTTGSPGRL